MVTLDLSKKTHLKVLCLGAHSDDIEIGCGGTILRLADQYQRHLEVFWAVFSANGERENEAVKSAGSFLKDAKTKRIVTYHHRDGYFSSTAAGIKESFETIGKEFSPDLLFTHYRDDRHQDHRLISDLTWETFRDHLILEYEIPKYDGDFGSPNLFVPLDGKTCKRKNGFIFKHFKSQAQKHWLTEETLLSVVRLRGIESGRSSRYAEAFYCRKMVL